MDKYDLPLPGKDASNEDSGYYWGRRMVDYDQKLKAYGEKLSRDPQTKEQIREVFRKNYPEFENLSADQQRFVVEANMIGDTPFIRKYLPNYREFTGDFQKNYLGERLPKEYKTPVEKPRSPEQNPYVYTDEDAVKELQRRHDNNDAKRSRK